MPFAAPDTVARTATGALANTSAGSAAFQRGTLMQEAGGDASVGPEGVRVVGRDMEEKKMVYDDSAGVALQRGAWGAGPGAPGVVGQAGPAARQ